MKPWNDFVKQYSWNAMSYMNLTLDQPDVELTWFPDRWLQFSRDEPKPWLGAEVATPLLLMRIYMGGNCIICSEHVCITSFCAWTFFLQLRPSRIFPYSSMRLSLSPCFLCNILQRFGGYFWGKSWGTYRPQATTQMNIEDFSLFAGWWCLFWGGISTWLLMKRSNLTTVNVFSKEWSWNHQLVGHLLYKC